MSRPIAGDPCCGGWGDYPSRVRGAWIRLCVAAAVVTTGVECGRINVEHLRPEAGAGGEVAGVEQAGGADAAVGGTAGGAQAASGTAGVSASGTGGVRGGAAGTQGGTAGTGGGSGGTGGVQGGAGGTTGGGNAGSSAGASGAGATAGSGGSMVGGFAGTSGAGAAVVGGAGGLGGLGGIGGAGNAGALAGAGGTAGATGGTAGTGGVTAGDLHVTTALDEDDAGASVADPGGTGLSLREAVGLANAASGDQSITFEPNLTITLGSGLTVTDGVDIQGDGTTVDCSPIGGGTDCITLAVASGSTGVHGLTIVEARNSAIHVTSGNDYEITDCVFSNCGIGIEIGIDVSNVRIANNVVSGSGGDGIWAGGPNPTIEGNQVYDSGGRSIYLGPNASGARLVGNLVVRGNYGVLFFNSVSGAVLRHNTLVYASMDELLIGIAQADEVTNNVFAYAGQLGIRATDAVIAYRDHNAYFANVGGDCLSCSPDAHAVTGDPLFVDVLTDDYTPGPGSPLIDAGTDRGEDRNGPAAGLFNGLGPDIGWIETP